MHNLIKSGYVLEDKNRITALNKININEIINNIVNLLKKDQIILIKNVSQSEADSILLFLAEELKLDESLKIQAAFASSLGHRENVGRYFMSVNKRKDYQFVAPHSEGGSFNNMRLAAFYCIENTTDGGETILFNINQRYEAWSQLKEKVKRGKANRPLTEPEVNQIKAALRLNMPADELKWDDEILTQKQITPDFTIFDVLTKPQKKFCNLLGEEIYTFWDSIESNYHNSALEFKNLLIEDGLLKLPSHQVGVDLLDESAHRRIKHLDISYQKLFKCKVTHKLKAGELIIQNNLTWTHAVNNWTPGVGSRIVVAAFA